MGRGYLLLAACFYALGVVVGTYLSLPPFYPLFILLLFFFPLLFLLNRRESRLCIPLLFLQILFFGLFFTSLRFHSYLSPTSFFHLSGQEVHLQGSVVRIPQEIPGGFVFTVRPTIRMEGEEIFPISSGLLQVYSHEEGIFSGDLVQIKGMVNRPPGLKNPGGFSYRHYLFRQGIAGTYFQREGEELWVERGPRGFFSLVQQMKEWVGRRIEEGFAAPYSSMVRALLLGERELLPGQVEELFRKTGLGHLLAVSGLHVGILSLFLWRFFLFLGWTKRQAAYPIILFMGFYMVMCGLRPSIVRASLVVIFYCLSKIFDKKIQLLDLTGLSALLLLFMNPFLLFEVGFQLSYLVYLSILFFTPLLSPYMTSFLPEKIGLPISLSLAAQIGAWPVVAYYFHMFSLWPVVANLAAIPLLSLILTLVIPALLLSLFSTSLYGLLALLIRLLLQVLLLLLEFLSSVPIMLLRSGKIPLPFLFLYLLLLSLLLIFLLKKRRGVSFTHSEKWVVILLCLLVFLNLFFLFQEGEEGILRAYFLDVGQGLAVFFVLPGGETLFYDGGGLYSFHRPDYNLVAETIIYPLLAYKGIEEVDGIIISHYHNDHVQGLLPLLQGGGTSFVASPKRGEGLLLSELFLKVERLTAQNQIPFFFLEEGDQFRFGEVFFKVLAPPETLLLNTGSDENNNSLVIGVHYREQRLLLTGDMEQEMEALLLANGRRRPFLSAQLLQVGHHGSNTSSTGPFLEAVRPAVSIISSSPGRFDHPSPQVLKRLLQVGTEIYRTDISGAIVVETDGVEMSVYPYWQDKTNFQLMTTVGGNY